MSDNDTTNSPQDQTQRLTEEELWLIPFDFTQVVYNETNGVYEAVFQGDDIFTAELPTDNTTVITLNSLPPRDTERNTPVYSTLKNSIHTLVSQHTETDKFIGAN